MIVMEHRTKLYFQIYATKGAGIKKPLKASADKGFKVLRGQDSNLRPLGYEPIPPVKYSDTKRHIMKCNCLINRCMIFCLILSGFIF